MEEKIVYNRHLACDDEIIVNISIDDGKVYHQRCIINSISNDLVDMGFTGDEVPEWELVRVGTPLELRGRSDRGAFGCRAVVVDCNIAGHYLVRLIGSIYLGELREFQRMDVYVPVKYALNTSQSLEAITDDWLQRKGDLKQAPKHKDASTAWVDTSNSENWTEAVPSLALITNEGIRIDIPERISAGGHLDLELYLPLAPPLTIAAVAEISGHEDDVVFEDGTRLHRTNLTFTLIDTTARESINDYVSAIQVQHLGEICKDAQYESLYKRLSSQLNAKDPLRPLKRGITVLILLILSILLFRYLVEYRKGHEKGFIEKVFEEGVRHYQDKFK